MWTRWATLQGLPRAFLAVQARRGEPLARLLVGPQRGGDPYPLIEQIRARGRLTRTPFVSVTADHELCRTILRDDRFGVTTPTNLDLPKPIRWLIRQTDPQLPNPAEPPSMLQVDPPDHTRYRRPVAHAFTPRAIDKLHTRIIEVTNELLDRLESTPCADLIADFAGPLPAEIIAEVLGVPEEVRPGAIVVRHCWISACPGRHFDVACKHCGKATEISGTTLTGCVSNPATTSSAR